MRTASSRTAAAVEVAVVEFEVEVAAVEVEVAGVEDQSNSEPYFDCE